MISKNQRFRPKSVKTFRVPPLRFFYPWTSVHWQDNVKPFNGLLSRGLSLSGRHKTYWTEGAFNKRLGHSHQGLLLYIWITTLQLYIKFFKMAMADIWRVLDKRSNARRTNRWRHFPYNHWHTGNGIFFMHCTLHRSYYVMVRPSVQPGRSGNFRVELKTRFLTAKATMAWYYNVISRRELRFKRLVVLRGTVHMSAWQEAQKCAAKGHQVRAILLHSYEINSCCTHQEARWKD